VCVCVCVCAWVCACGFVCIQCEMQIWTSLLARYQTQSDSRHSQKDRKRGSFDCRDFSNPRMWKISPQICDLVFAVRHMTHTYVCTHVHIHTRICMYIHTRIKMCVYIYIYNVNIRVYVSTHIHIYIGKYTCLQMWVYMNTYTKIKCVNMYMHVWRRWGRG